MKNRFTLLFSLLCIFSYDSLALDLNALLGKANSAIQTVQNAKNAVVQKATDLKTTAQQKVDTAKAVVNTVADEGKKLVGLPTGEATLANEGEVAEGQVLEEDTSIESDLSDVSAQDVAIDPYEGLEQEQQSMIDQKLTDLNSVLNFNGMDLSNIVAVQYLCDQLTLLYANGKEGLFIDISNSGITEDGLMLLFENLKSCPKLIKSFFAAGNNFSSNAALIISENLPSFPSIEYINLDDNSLADDGFLAILDSLIRSKNSIISYLSLRNNSITETGITPAIEISNDFAAGALKEGIMLGGNQSPQNVELPALFIMA